MQGLGCSVCHALLRHAADELHGAICSVLQPASIAKVERVWCLSSPLVSSFGSDMLRWRSLCSRSGGVKALSPPIPPGFLSWLPTVLSIPEDFVVKAVSVDAAVYLKFLQTCTMHICYAERLL